MADPNGSFQINDGHTAGCLTISVHILEHWTGLEARATSGHAGVGLDTPVPGSAREVLGGGLGKGLISQERSHFVRAHISFGDLAFMTDS